MREEEMARHRHGAIQLPKIEKAFFLTPEIKVFGIALKLSEVCPIYNRTYPDYLNHFEK